MHRRLSNKFGTKRASDWESVRSGGGESLNDVRSFTIRWAKGSSRKVSGEVIGVSGCRNNEDNEVELFLGAR